MRSLVERSWLSRRRFTTAPEEAIAEALPPFDGGSLYRVILQLVSEQPKTSFEISRALLAREDFRNEVSPVVMAATLNAMTARGWLQRTVFRSQFRFVLTPDGEKALAELTA